MNNLENQRQEAVAERILVFIPAYRCSKQITRAIAQFEGVERYFAEVLVVDNRSSDNTLEATRVAAARARLPVTIVRKRQLGPRWFPQGGLRVRGRSWFRLLRRAPR